MLILEISPENTLYRNDVGSEHSGALDYVVDSKTNTVNAAHDEEIQLQVMIIKWIEIEVGAESVKLHKYFVFDICRKLKRSTDFTLCYHN